MRISPINLLVSNIKNNKHTRNTSVNNNNNNNSIAFSSLSSDCFVRNRECNLTCHDRFELPEKELALKEGKYIYDIFEDINEFASTKLEQVYEYLSEGAGFEYHDNGTLKTISDLENGYGVITSFDDVGNVIQRVTLDNYKVSKMVNFHIDTGKSDELYFADDKLTQVQLGADNRYVDAGFSLLNSNDSEILTVRQGSIKNTGNCDSRYIFRDGKLQSVFLLTTYPDDKVYPDKNYKYSTIWFD